MKGFKDKSGKFRPTGNRRRSPLTISQIRDKGKLEMQHGFKVYPHTEVKVNHEELPPEIIERVQYLWNNDPHMKKMRKHVKHIDMNVNNPDEEKVIAYWEEHDKRFALKEDDDELEAELSTVHEVVGHAFWDWAKKWRREELIEFNELANSMPPITQYMREEEKEWRKINDDEGRLDMLKNDHDIILRKYYDPDNPDTEYQKQIDDLLGEMEEEVDEIEADEGHLSMTRYANEMHSAMTELMYGVGEDERTIFLNDEQLEELTNAWDKLHS